MRQEKNNRSVFLPLMEVVLLSKSITLVSVDGQGYDYTSEKLVCVCLWEEEKKERVLGIEMAFVRGHMHQCLNTCACLA